jgi:radical SAM superfamily enzyme YgiQ (UPF0313 family)
MSMQEARDRGWDELDVVFVTGDAYIDHPSFAMSILGRVLEAAGYRVGIVSQPDWQSCNDWQRFGRPRLFFAISAGNMDSMINHYTANRKVRNDDAYSPGGRIGLRPDRATLAYCQRARQAYKGVPIIAGGVEASLRRLAHYDYWSDKVRRSILLDAKADLVAFGMGENSIIEMARRLEEGQSVKDLRDMRGVAYALGASETIPQDALELPSYEAVSSDKVAFSIATRMIHNETNPLNARRLVQRHGPLLVQHVFRHAVGKAGALCQTQCHTVGCGTQRIDAPLGVGQAVQLVVMKDHGVAVRRDLHVAFDGIAMSEGRARRRQRVFDPPRRAIMQAAMGNGAICEPVEHHIPADLAAALCRAVSAPYFCHVS